MGPLTKPEYEALKALLTEIEKAEAQLGRPFRNHPVEGVRQVDDMRAAVRAAVEGYEAANREAR